MPLTVIVRASDARNASGEPLELTLDGARIVVGRGSGCDVRLPDATVSHRHATIHAQGASYTLVDEGSANGTRIGNTRIEANVPHAVASGDRVRLGRVWIELRIDQTPPPHDLAQATRDLALALVSQGLREAGANVVPALEVVEGRDAGARLELAEEGRVYVIGRADGADLLLSDVDASREHGQVVRRGNVVLLRDRGSKNGLFLGGVEVPRERDVAWKATSHLVLGATVISLDEPVSQALAELEAQADEHVDGAELEATAPAEPPDLRVAETRSSPPERAQRVRAPAARPSMRGGHSRGWTSADFGVLGLAALVLALSVVGLFWLLGK